MDDEVLDWNDGHRGPRTSDPAPKSKSKDVKPRTQKTALQKEVLEASYTINQFPSEEHRRALGERIGLTEAQVQVWFTNRRRKDKKVDDPGRRDAGADDDSDVPLAACLRKERGGGARSKPPSKARSAPSKEASAWAQDIARMTMGSPPGAALVSPGYPPAGRRTSHCTSHAAPAHDEEEEEEEDDYQDFIPTAVRPPVRPARSPRPSPSPQPVHEPAQDSSDAETEDAPEAIMAAQRNELEELLYYARRLLPVSYREDGPPLAIDFDDAPPKPQRRGVTGKRRAAAPAEGGRSKQARPSPGPDMDDDTKSRTYEYVAQVAKATADGPGGRGKRQTGIAKKMESHIKKEQDRIRKEMLKQQEKLERDRKKEEEEYLKEQERLEKERRKQLEKLEKERMKEEVRRAKELEKLEVARQKEIKKLEVKMQKERKAEEKRKEAEAKRRDKEMQRALAQQEKSIIRLRQRETQVGPPDDADLEWEKLMEAANLDGYASDTEGQAAQRPGLRRPDFPPPSLNLSPAFPPMMGEEAGSELLVVWNFLHSFGELLGMVCPNLDHLLEAIMVGQESVVLADVHCALLRLLQADMEEAHATGATQAGAGSNFVDRALFNNAAMLDEAHAWGFDVDMWRAHLNLLTWPEVLRQLAISAGWSERRARAKRESKVRLGTEGEDIVVDEAGGLKLRMPSRFGVGTVKGAAWQVLAEDGLKHGPRGLKIEEIARIIQEEGLRDLTTSKTPEATVAGGLSRDIIFCRVAPATYALQAVVSYHRRLRERAERAKAEASHKDGSAAEGKSDMKMEDADVQVMKKEDTHHEHSHHDQNEDAEHEDSDSEDEEEGDQGGDLGREAWASALLTCEYDDLSFRDRLAALTRLCHVCSNSTSVRQRLEHRSEEAARLKKQLWEEAKAERRQRQEEAVSKARIALEEAARLESMQDQSAAMAEAVARRAKTEAEEAAVAEQDRQRRALRAEKLRMVEEEFSIRVEPLGMDRRFNRYWRFCTGGPHADRQGSGRLWVESQVDGTWRVLTQQRQLDQLKAALEPKGAREGPLSSALVRNTPALAQCMPAAPLRMPDVDASAVRQRVNTSMQSALQGVVLRAAALMHGQPDYVDDIDLPPRDNPTVAKIKRDMLRIEARISGDMFDDETFSRYNWMDRVQAAVTTEEVRDCLGELEAAIDENYLSLQFARLPVLVKGAWLPIGKEVAMVAADGHSLPLAESTIDTPEVDHHPLHWLPATLPAISLRLQALDAAILYPDPIGPDYKSTTLNGKLCGRDQLLAYHYIQRPTAPCRARPPPQSGAPQPSAHSGGCRTVLGAPLHPMGRVKTTAFPAFPVAVLQAGMQAFEVDLQRFRRAVEQAAQNGSLYEQPGAVAAVEAVAALNRSRGRPPANRQAGGSRNSSERSRTPKPRSNGQSNWKGSNTQPTFSQSSSRAAHHSPAMGDEEDYGMEEEGDHAANGDGYYGQAQPPRGRLGYSGPSSYDDDFMDDSPEGGTARGRGQSQADTQDEDLQDPLSEDESDDGVGSPPYTTGKRRYTAAYTDDSE